MREKEIFLSVVIPEYNEIKNLERGVLDEVQSYLSQQKYTWEVIISDDGSSDKSDLFAQKFVSKNKNFKFIKGDHGGKAYALFNGLKSARGTIVLVTDMDQSTPIQELDKLIPWFEEGYDVVIGSRGRKRDSSSLPRKLASFLFSNFRRSLLLWNISDTQCGFKAFKLDQIVDLFSRLEAVNTIATRGWVVSAFDVELLFMAQKAGLKIKEVEVDWQNEDVSETKDRKFVRESLDMLKQIFKVKFNDFRGKYERRQ